MNYNYIISIGNDCRIANALIFLKLRTISLPSDWIHSSINKICNAFKTDFINFFNYQNLILYKNKYLKEPNDITVYYHIPDNVKTAIEMFKRRTKRMTNILENNNNILFIRISETDTYIDILNLYDIISNKYTIDFKILFITSNKCISNNDNIHIIYIPTKTHKNTNHIGSQNTINNTIKTYLKL